MDGLLVSFKSRFLVSVNEHFAGLLIRLKDNIVNSYYNKTINNNTSSSSSIIDTWISIIIIIITLV